MNFRHPDAPKPEPQTAPPYVPGPFFAELQWDAIVTLEGGSQGLRGFGKNLDAPTRGELRELIRDWRARVGVALNVIAYELVDGRRHYLNERGELVNGAQGARAALRGAGLVPERPNPARGVVYPQTQETK